MRAARFLMLHAVNKVKSQRAIFLQYRLQHARTLPPAPPKELGCFGWTPDSTPSSPGHAACPAPQSPNGFFFFPSELPSVAVLYLLT